MTAEASTHTERARVVIDRCGAAEVIRIGPPGWDGGLTREVLDAVVPAVMAAPAPGVRHRVLTGGGATFCTGVDLATARAATSRPGGDVDFWRVRIALVTELVSGLRDSPVPVVAAVQGQAAGAGLALALACDARVLADTAALYTAYLQVGATPDGGLSWLLPRYVGTAAAWRLLTADPVVRPARAVELGLADSVAPAADVLACALDLGDRLGALPPGALRATRRLLDEASEASLSAHMERERDAFLARAGSHELAEGVAAVLDRRLPQF